MKTVQPPVSGDVSDMIYREILRIRSKGGRSALAVVTRAVGSTPGKPGFKMLVYPGGKVLGTVGGGAFEGKVISEALEVINECVTRRFDFKFSDSNCATRSDKPICGGEVTVFIEPIYARPRLYIIGAGHIGQEVAKIGKMIGFNIIIVDDRGEFANQQNFPDADEILLMDFAEIADRIEIDETCYIVIVTRGHLYDETVLKALIKSKATYIGMIGSKKKVKATFRNLIDCGVEEELVKRIHAPIGLDIGARTPSEIAVSITAEIVAHRYNASGEKLSVNRSSYSSESHDAERA